MGRSGEETARSSESDKKQGLFGRMKGMFKTKEKEYFESRWKKQSAIPIEQQTPEMRTGRIVYRLLLAFSTVLILYEADLSRVEKLLESELPNMAKSLPGVVKLPKYRGVNSFEESYMLLKINIYCIPRFRRKAHRALLRQIKLLFDRENIAVPYSRIVIRNYSDEIKGMDAFESEDEDLPEDAGVLACADITEDAGVLAGADITEDAGVLACADIMEDAGALDAAENTEDAGGGGRRRYNGG